MFERLEYLGHLDTDNKTDLWLLHCVFIDVINQKIDEFKRYYDPHPLSTAGHKSPHNLWITSSFKNQVINTILDAETLHHLSEWKPHILFLEMGQ